MIGMQREGKENIMRLNKHEVPGIYAIPALIISSSPSFPPCAANLPFRSPPPPPSLGQHPHSLAIPANACTLALTAIVSPIWRTLPFALENPVTLALLPQHEGSLTPPCL